MSNSGSVTTWIALLEAGDVVAAQRLWEAYYRRLVGLARKRLQGQPRAAADEEDVALSAFASFWRNAKLNKFPRLNDRHDLWQLLVLLTARKASRLIRHERALKRGGASRRASPLDEDGADALDDVIGAEPTPAFAAEVAEQYRLLLDGLEPSDRAVAVAKMEGDTNKEIAARLDVSVRTVERSLAVIRKLWEAKDQP
jgi:RNA polymerase sigma factor (sigma-70 family)